MQSQLLQQCAGRKGNEVERGICSTVHLRWLFSSVPVYLGVMMSHRPCHKHCVSFPPPWLTSLHISQDLFLCAPPTAPSEALPFCFCSVIQLMGCCASARHESQHHWLLLHSFICAVTGQIIYRGNNGLLDPAHSIHLNCTLSVD